MVLVGQRTRIKNRIHANLAKYGVAVGGASDLFGVRGRVLLKKRLGELPSETRYATERLMEALDHLDEQIQGFEERMAELFQPARELELIETLPGVGFILGVVILTEVGIHTQERMDSRLHGNDKAS